MNLLVLDTTTKSIEALLSGAPATTQPDYSSHHAEVDATTFTEGEKDGTLNGTTAVTIVAAPSAGFRKIIREIVIFNTDTAAVTLTVRINVSGTFRTLWSGSLAVGASWRLSDGAIATGGVTAHSALTGLSGDDHLQYLLATGLREWSEQGSDPSTPASTKWKLYFKSGGLYYIDDAGAVIGPLSTGGGASGHGQCYLSKSGTNLILMPYNGTQLIINSAAQTIPDAGVTLAPPAVASTTYYIYAYMNTGTMTLEQSTTVPVAQAITGVMIKTADATRTLVGMARTTSGNAWADSDTQMFVLSYFNRKGKAGKNNFTANRTTTSTSYVELSTEIRVEFLTWADEAQNFSLGGRGNNGTGGGANGTSFGIDGTTAVDTVTEAQAYTAGATLAYALSYNVDALAVGYHYVTVLGKVTSGTGQWDGNATAGTRVAMTVKNRG